MAAVTKPVVLDETGKVSNQKIEAISTKIEADTQSLSRQLQALAGKTTENAEAINRGIGALATKTVENTMAMNQKIDDLVAELATEIPSIIAAMDRIDIIYYVEN